MFWPLALLLAAFAYRAVGCKGRGADEKKKWPTQLTVRFTYPPVKATMTIPPWVTTGPRLGE
jgi:hypothetical protein